MKQEQKLNVGTTLMMATGPVYVVTRPTSKKKKQVEKNLKRALEAAR